MQMITIQGVGLLFKDACSGHLRGFISGLGTLYYKSIMASDAMLDFRQMREWSHVDETWWNYKGRHAKVMYMVSLQTGSKIPIWQPFVFRNRM